MHAHSHMPSDLTRHILTLPSAARCWPFSSHPSVLSHPKFSSARLSKSSSGAPMSESISLSRIIAPFPLFFKKLAWCGPLHPMSLGTRQAYRTKTRIESSRNQDTARLHCGCHC
ncbi:hypothetical protein IF1G_07108 [Cordyceps javanica]|uniref:Uncharacterized protein n=1 Tax=Cordyceps javanica TaxID=43265 RepID=A0A545UXN4_9HYPO|nr:hypothetical protein IF1G_07108 [Cordyceps javanica]